MVDRERENGCRSLTIRRLDCNILRLNELRRRRSMTENVIDKRRTDAYHHWSRHRLIQWDSSMCLHRTREKMKNVQRDTPLTFTRGLLIWLIIRSSHSTVPAWNIPSSILRFRPSLFTLMINDSSCWRLFWKGQQCRKTSMLCNLPTILKWQMCVSGTEQRRRGGFTRGAVRVVPSRRDWAPERGRESWPTA